MSYSSTENELEDLFAIYGDVISCAIPTDRESVLRTLAEGHDALFAALAVSDVNAPRLDETAVRTRG